jgi:phosphatidyl-myo-inositol dimannoside synthase
MKILLLISDAFGSRGGIAQFNRDLLTSFCTYYPSITVIAIPRKIVDPVGVIPSNLTYVRKGISSKMSFLKAVFDICKNNTQFDLVVCGHINLLGPTYLIKIFSKSPVALVVYGIDVWEPSSNLLLNKLVNTIDFLISISQLTTQKLKKWTEIDKVPSFILPCTVNLNLFTPGMKNIELLDRYQLAGKTIIMTVGRLVSAEQYKGFDAVIDLLTGLIEDIPDLLYLIVGEGNDRARLESKVKSLGLEDHVVFTGFISEEEKADHYRLADAYVMPGKGEGFGIVYLEAMACGIPVVASKVDGSREAVRDGMLGILVDPDNPAEIKAGILEALTRPSGIAPEGLDYFSDRNFEKRVHAILDEIL